MAPAGTPAVVGGETTKLIGHMTIDMLTLDLPDLPDDGVDNRVELWGERVCANAVER